MHRLSRRAALAGAAANFMIRPARSAGRDFGAEFAALEQRSGGRLGVAGFDFAAGDRVEYRASERFPFCSTYKLLAAAAVLARVDRGDETLERRILFGTSEVVAGSPVTSRRTDRDGMSIAELCAAALTVSDNTAANLLLGTIGGPAGLTAYARTLGDEATRLDRIETDLNQALPGDPRDTTTPAAMLEDLRRLVLGDALAQPSREQLTTWLLASKTGDGRLRAGVPKSWRVAGKTGTGQNGTANDVAAFWPPDRSPIAVAAFLTGSKLNLEGQNGVLADVARLITGTPAGPAKPAPPPVRRR